MSDANLNEKDGASQSMWLTVAFTFSVAAFGFQIAGLVADPTISNGAFAATAAVVSYFIWRLQSRHRHDLRLRSTQPDVIVPGAKTHLGRADFDALPLPVLIVDDRAQILSANKAANTEFGRFDIGGALLLRFRAPEMRKAFQSSVEQGQPSHFEMHERVPLERWMRVDVCPVHINADENAFCLIMFRDVSESRKLDRIRSDFVANASHELRTPLASISGFIDTLRGPAKNDEKARDRFLAIMQDQANRMSRLIDDLLSLSRLEMRSMTDEAEPVDLVMVTSEAIDSIQPVANEGGVVIERNFAPGEYVIRGLRDEMIQVAENLIENACKYGKSGKKVIVDIKKRKAGDSHEIMLAVRDFGPGIDAEHIPRLTERFYRANSKTSSAQKGTGLGLAIVKHIVTRHRGRLSISSKPGKGSTFAIYFPSIDGDAKDGFE